jgi:hypothetical protein
MDKTMKYPVKQIETTACHTIFDVDGEKVILWIITGGTPALDFYPDYSHTKRFPNWQEKWFNHHFHAKTFCVSSHYDHQDPKNVQGPTFVDLPNGEQDFIEWFEANRAEHALRVQRFNGLPHKRIVSKRTLDKEERTFVTAELDFRLNSISPVTFNSAYYCGRLDEKMVLFSEWWKKTQAIFNAYSKKNTHWENLTEEQYQEIVNHLKGWDGK